MRDVNEVDQSAVYAEIERFGTWIGTYPYVEDADSVMIGRVGSRTYELRIPGPLAWAEGSVPRLSGMSVDNPDDGILDVPGINRDVGMYVLGGLTPMEALAWALRVRDIPTSDAIAYMAKALGKDVTMNAWRVYLTRARNRMENIARIESPERTLQGRHGVRLRANARETAIPTRFRRSGHSARALSFHHAAII